MQLGFVTAILPDQSLEDVFQIAADIGYDCIEVMCWPPGKAERRYAGITHIDVTTLTADRINEIHTLSDRYKVRISGLGYYPNPLTPDKDLQKIYVDQILAIIRAAARLKIDVVNTFVGRDPVKSVDDNWEEFTKIWTPIIGQAQAFGIKIGIENCPMLFTADEWPGGLNLATTPAIWRRMWKFFPTLNFGLNYDPSHMIIQHMDTTYPITAFPERMIHIHAKDAVIDQERLNEVGVFAHPNLWHTPKIPGRGSVDWGKLVKKLKQIDYQGAICVEVEDRAYEGSLENRILALKESYDHLRQFVPKI